MARLAACIVLPVFTASVALGVLGAGGCQTGAPPSAATVASTPTANDPADLDRLVRWMSGSFTSVAQASRDPDFRVIELHMTPIWTDRTDGRWLYVEQATATARDKPYRQRVYRVVAVDEATSGTTSGAAQPRRFRSDVFEFAGDPLRYAGAWQDVGRLGHLVPADLILRDGCSITMRREDNAFVGGTEGRGCPSSLRGASYATSEVRITEGLLVSWDRGWDANGKQAWGAVKGGYEFVRVAAAAQ